MGKFLTRIQNKFKSFLFNIDIFNQNLDTFVLKGWLFSKKGSISDVHFLIKDSNGKEHILQGSYKIRRLDVYNAFKISNSEKSGFYVSAVVEDCSFYSVWILFKENGKNKRIFAGKIENDEDKNFDKNVSFNEIQTEELGFDLQRFLAKQKEYNYIFPKKYYSECVDLILPVYNGYKFFDKLFKTIEKTNISYRLIIIDDLSSDKRVYPYLEKYANGKQNVILLQNEKNLGFVQTVNKGLELSKNHVAIINSDIELPNEWLERLMLPIFENEKIASTTPYTTCGTICSFPKFLEDNKLFLGLNVDEIDYCFKNIKPCYTSLPTGVGFCMGMSKLAIKNIGVLDAETFGKGYAEENDWCQRAIEAGYINVQIENLFVFHNHGGSFPSEEKKRLISEHEKLLLSKHPNYNRDVAKFCSIDPNKQLRSFIELNLLQKYKKLHTVLAFDHALGGGATNYLMKKKEESIENNQAFIIVRFNTLNDIFEMEYFNQNGVIKSFAPMDFGISNILHYFNVDEIWINELVSYVNLYEVLHSIKKYSEKNNIPVRMLMHDYYAVCPTINLLDNEGKYCEIPSCSKCSKCIENSNIIQAMGIESMSRWRKEWKDFLSSCNEVIVFSHSSQEILNKAFDNCLNNIKVIPHEISYIPKIQKKNKTTKSFNIGLLGVLSEHKGEQIVKELIRLIGKKQLNIKIKLIGVSDNIKNGKYFSQTGAYSRNSLPYLSLENDIDIFLIPSIWPETFSYTSEEVMRMGFPLMCFDLGAPAERVKKYDKGIIISKISAEAVINTLETNNFIQSLKQIPVVLSRVLFVVEDVTFSSRYRVDHLREQLFIQGIASDCIDEDNVNKVIVENYNSIVVYRSSDYSAIETLCNKAKNKGISVYYDIDDLIFEYSLIKDLEFLNDDEYKDFNCYTQKIKKTMDLCDGYIVSTNCLKKQVQKLFLNKPVVVNRNVASLEMLSISENEIKKEKNNNEIIIGYFSGTKTHNADFESIKSVLIDLMKNNDNVKLLIGGQIILPNEFASFQNRIKRFDFVDWKSLPHLISQVDINLMPLENTVFHECKSENKWMEAGLVSVPTVASWNEELGSVIHDGVDGFLCKNTEEWQKKLNLLAESKELRQYISKNVHKRVVTEYTTFTVESIVPVFLKVKDNFEQKN